MALEHLLAALEQAVDAEIAEIRAGAKEDVQRIQAETVADAQTLRKTRLESVQPRIRAEQHRRMGQARLDAQRTWLEARRELANAVFEAVHVELSQARGRNDYVRIMAALIDEIIAELGSSICLEIDPRDGNLVDRVLKESGREISVEESLECWGGVIGHSADGRITVDNTLEARAMQAETLYRGTVADLLTREEYDAG